MAPRSERDPSVVEVAAVTGGGLLLAVVMTWPLVLRWRTHVVQDEGDPLLQAWQVAWGGHALRTDLASIFQSNAFWPLPDSLAFSDALLGYAPAGLVGAGMTAASVRHGVLVLLACTLALVGAHLLARELGVRPVPALLAGVVFAWAPWRLAHLGHLNILSTGGVALTFFLLARGYRLRRWGLVLAGWLVAAWQLSLGLGAGLFFAYALLVVAGVAGLWWLRAGRPWPGRAVVVATVVGGLVLVGTAGLQAVPYLRVLDAHPEAVRTVGYLDLYSPPLRGLLAAPSQSWLWGGVTEALRDGMTWAPEQSRFVGVVAVVAGLGGFVAGRQRRSLRVGLAVAVVVTSVLALGTMLFGGRFTYLPLYEVLPGWQGIRTPGRWITMTTLALGLLAAFGADRLWGSGAGQRLRRRRVAVVGLVALAVLEGTGRTPIVEVPRPSSAEVFAVPGPRLHLPSTVTGDQVFMLWTTEEGFPAVVNGASGFVPDALEQVRRDVADFPSAASVAALRDLGVRSVVLHPDLARGTPWEAAAQRSVEGLDVTRREVGDAVVFDLGG